MAAVARGARGPVGERRIGKSPNALGTCIAKTRFDGFPGISLAFSLLNLKRFGKIKPTPAESQKGTALKWDGSGERCDQCTGHQSKVRGLSSVLLAKFCH